MKKISLTFIALAMTLSVAAQNFGQIDSLMKSYRQENKIPGMAYAIAVDGEIQHQNAIGTADLRHNVPVRTNTVFELASVSKQFTAAALLLLEQDGKLSLDDPISDYIPDCPEFCDNITIEQLLNNTSGLSGMKDSYDLMYDKWGWQMERKDKHWLSVLHGDTLKFTPGERFEYSDLGYNMAGLIIKYVSGQPTGEFMVDRFFEPLEMTTTYAEDEYRITPNESNGYLLREDVIVSNRRDWGRETVGSGGILSTVADMIRWESSLTNNEILSAENVDRLFRATELNNGFVSYYGLGWHLVDMFGTEVQLHTGRTGTSIIRVPSQKLCIVTLTNLEQATGGGIQILQHLLPNYVEKSDQGDHNNISDYVGQYVGPENIESQVVVSDGKVQFIFGEYFTDDLIYYRDDIFFVKDVSELHYQFQRDDNDNVVGLILYDYLRDNLSLKKI